MLPETKLELKSCTKEQMIELLEIHKYANTIASIYKCSKYDIQKYIRKLGINYHRGRNYDIIIGDIVNNMKVISFKRPYYLCECLKCNKINELSTAYFLESSNRRDLIRCKTCDAKIGNKHKRWLGFQEISGNYYSGIKNRAIKDGLGFNLTMEDIWNQYEKQNRKCIITEEYIKFPKFSRGKTYQDKHFASIDRIDNNIGYESNNIWVVHQDFNFYHWAWNKEEILYYSQLISNPIKENKSTISEIPLWYWTRIYDKMIRVFKRGLNVSITDKDVINQYNKQNGLCYYTGLSVNFPITVKTRGTQTASIDRIDSNKGYTQDNIVICHKNINAMKSDLTIDRFYFIAKMAAKNLPKLIAVQSSLD